ncbi:hypothetical protein BDV93DRAFT_607729, partial [Ceratobasidium sp. AG-I]
MTATIQFSGLRVFETVELLSLICGHATVSDCALVMRTNRLGFDVAIPFVWGHVNGVDELLRLLPNASIVLNKKGKARKIVLPAISNTDFVRFNLYGRAVKSLKINGVGKPSCEVTDIRTLRLQAQKQTLLPNLKTFIFDEIITRADHSTLPVRWVQVFSSPSLENIHFISHTYEYAMPTSCSVGSAIMDAIAELRPTLRKLSLFPARTTNNEAVGEPHLVNQQLLLSYFPDFRNLCELETSTPMLHPDALRVLGNLSRLKCLTFLAVPGWHMPWRLTTDLPESLFPALEYLALKDLNPGDIERVLAVLPLVQNITSLQIKTEVDDEDFYDSELESNSSSDDGHEGGEVGGRVIGDRHKYGEAKNIFLWLGNAQRLTSLHVDLYDAEWAPLGPRDISAPRICKILSQLPLRILDLRGLIFGNTAALGSTFPMLSKLVLPNQLGPISMLYDFAAIPTLEHLGLQMLYEHEPPAQDRIPSFRSLHTLEFTLTHVDSMTICSKKKKSIAEDLRKMFPSIWLVVI